MSANASRVIIQTPPNLAFVYPMKLFLCCLLATAIGVSAQECDPQAAAQTLVENEAKFVQLGHDQGSRAAFLHFLADDAITFQPSPINAKKSWLARKDDGPSLKWQPVFAAAARSCDLGYTTGPAEWRRRKEDEKPLGYGQSVSIWKKQNDGEWRVVIDIGGSAPGAQKVDDPPEVAAPTTTAPAHRSLADAKKKLREAEIWFTNTAKTDSTAALIGSSDPSVRVIRDGVFPAAGRAPANLMLSVRRGELTSERLGGDMSEAGDFAYSYGKYTLVRSQDTEKGHYLQIWRTDDKGAWKVTLDFQSPLPTGQK
jgi:ketosteroid isomerase-like protein